MKTRLTNYKKIEISVDQDTGTFHVPAVNTIAYTSLAVVKTVIDKHIELKMPKLNIPILCRNGEDCTEHMATGIHVGYKYVLAKPALKDNYRQTIYPKVDDIRKLVAMSRRLSLAAEEIDELLHDSEIAGRYSSSTVTEAYEEFKNNAAIAKSAAGKLNADKIIAGILKKLAK